MMTKQFEFGVIQSSLILDEDEVRVLQSVSVV